MNCNYCGSEKSDIIAHYARFEKNNVLQCKNCSLVYLDIRKNKKEIELFYSSKYRKSPAIQVLSAKEHYNNEVLKNDAAARIGFLQRYIDIRGQRILELGSASGLMLAKLDEYGVKEAIGIELTKAFADYARRKGFNVVTQPIEKLNFKEKFDTVVTFFALEHLYDPMAAIKAVYTALKPQGYFIGEVPNQNDWRIQIFGDEIVKRLHYDPNHYYYYSPATLTNYLKTCGFEDIKLETSERYNSLVQLRNIICCKGRRKNIKDTLWKYISPKDKKNEVRLPNVDNRMETLFNRLFETGANSELMGNILRFAAFKR